VKIQHAVPLLILSGAIMAAGLGVASAQDPPMPQEHPRIDVTAPRIRQGLPLQNLPPQPPPMGGGGEGNGPAAPVQPFVTGIDYEPVPPGARVTFNLEDADLPDLVRLISSISGKRFILPGKVRSIKASVYAPTKVSAAEAYQAFLSILELNGMTVVPAGRYLKIVETTGIENLPTPLYTAGQNSPGDDRYVTRMERVENVSAEDVATLLARFKSREGNVTAYAPTNTIIMTDLGSNIRRMLRIVGAIDVPRGGEQVWIEPVHYANATELAERLNEIFPATTPGAAGAAPRVAAPGAPGAGPSTVGSRSGEVRVTKILPDERTNSLIIIATERAYVRILEMIRALDVALEGEGRIHVEYIQHGDAEDIATTLTSLVGGGGGAGAAPAGPGARAGAAGGGSPFEGQVRITAHKPTNSLVITSSMHDYASLRNVIARLDVSRRQVFIEAVIMELSVSRSSKLGLSFHGGVPGFPTSDALSIFGFNAGTSISTVSADSLTGLALGVRGPQIPAEQLQGIGLSIPAFGVVLNAIANSGDANVLSTPHLIAMDNEEAEISVGENVALQQSTALSGLAGLAGAAGQSSSALSALGGLSGLSGMMGGMGASSPRQDVGTKITITPHINEADEIRLEINEEISERGAVEGTAQVLSITKRNAKTQVVVRDQQTVVIGGLMRDTINTSETKVPILGDIPLIGVLFRSTTRETKKTNLLLFLTPYIIRDQGDLRAIFERKMRERQEFIDRYFVFGDQDYEPPVDYSRTRGLLSEMLNEVDSIDVEQRLAEEAAGRPPPEHVVRPAIGEVPSSPGTTTGDTVISPDGTSEVILEGSVPTPQLNITGDIPPQ
jgi:general secretion pathway protein D